MCYTPLTLTALLVSAPLITIPFILTPLFVQFLFGNRQCTFQQPLEVLKLPARFVPLAAFLLFFGQRRPAFRSVAPILQAGDERGLVRQLYNCL